MDELEIVEEDNLKNKYLIFSIGEELYGIEIRYVIEIISVIPITKMPGLADYAKGIINLRGKVIPVIDVRLKFKKAMREYDDKTCIVVVEISSISFGLIIDKVVEVASIDEENISLPPVIDQNEGGASDYIEGIGKMGDQITLLINCSKLLVDSKIGGSQSEF